MKIFLLILLFFSIPYLFCTAVENEEPPWVYRGRGDKYYRDGEIGKAIVEYKKALSASKRIYGTIRYPEVNLSLSMIYLSEGLYDLALLNISSAEQNESMLQIPDTIYDIRYTKAKIFQKMNRYNEAMAVYESIIKKDENWNFYSKLSPFDISAVFFNDPELKKKFGKAYFEIGKMKFDTRNYDNAVHFFKMSIMYGFKHDEALKLLINCYKLLNNNVVAEKVKKAYGKRL